MVIFHSYVSLPEDKLMKCLGPHKKQVPDCLKKHKSTRFEISESSYLVLHHVASQILIQRKTLQHWMTLQSLPWDPMENRKIGKNLPSHEEWWKRKHLSSFFAGPKPMVQLRWPCPRGLSVSDPAKFRHSIDGSHARQRIKVLGSTSRTILM